MIIAVLGRQPKLGLAELESLVGADKVKPIGDTAALVDASVDGARLGGTIKLAKPLTELETISWRDVEAHLVQQLPHHLEYLPAGKLNLGLSAYGISVKPEQLFRSGLELKKVARAQKRSVRIIPPKDTALNSAQVLHNQLTNELGWELLAIRNGHKTWLAQTTWVQNVDDYSRRDYGRPRRDAKVGMLPPKLAQIMLNLAGAKAGQTVLDPFCGTGVVLQEAALAGCLPCGTDLEPRMIDFSRENLQWLAANYNLTLEPRLEVADATSANWQSFDVVVTETYLGQALSGLPAPAKLQQIISDCDTIVGKFLTNLRPQLKAGQRLCVAVPAWRVAGQFKDLLLLDRLKNIGYNRQEFQHASLSDLIYHREDQIVARRLLVLTVKE